MGRTLAILLALTVSAEAAPVPKELKKSDLERMQGVWIDNKGTRHAYERRKLIVGQGFEYEITLRPDRSPKQYDLVGGEVKFSGIYEFVGEELHLAYRGEGGPRPKDFSDSAFTHIEILKRIPEAKK